MLSLTTYFCIHNYQLIHLKFFYISCTKRITVFFVVVVVVFKQLSEKQPNFKNPDWEAKSKYNKVILPSYCCHFGSIACQTQQDDHPSFLHPLV